MTALHALNGPDDPSPAARSAGQNTVNRSLTPKRARRLVENDDYAAFARRILRAYARRVADGDIDALDRHDSASSSRDRHRHRPGRDRPAPVRLLLGRDRLPARHHPPGRPATLGPGIVTAATAALDAEPLTRLGIGGDRRRHHHATGADFGRWERESPPTAAARARSGCAAAPT